MKMQVFTVYDKVVGAYLQPFFVRARGEALRSFTEACNDKSNNFYKYALDYTLVYLGEYDDQSGHFISRDPERVIGANECLSDSVFPPEREVTNGAGARVS